MNFWVKLDMRNNLFKDLVWSSYQYSTADDWTIKDNVLDNVNISQSYFGATEYVSHNAYAGGTSYLTGSQETGEFTTSIAYESGAFGEFYIDSSSTTLVNAGSRTAATAALAQYTILDSTTKDTSTVDIGFHYPAVDGNGDLYDADSDGHPDYLEDVNGDGTIGSTEYEPDDDLWVDFNVTPELLAELIMANTGAMVVPDSVIYTGADVARGTFGNGFATGVSGDGLPIDFGVILSSGSIFNAIGPNDTEGNASCSNNPSDLGEAGDSELNGLVDGGPTSDASALEFQIYVPSSMTLSFEYIFASEEYLEYVNEFNDPMGIFIGMENEEEEIEWTNIAVVDPEADPVVSIGVSTVFEIIDDPPSESNGELYQDNPVSSNIYNIQYDGLTLDDNNNDAALVASTSLSMGYYYIKVAIADYAAGECSPLDRILDSALFIKAQTTCQQ